MVFREVENGIASQKIESRHFYYHKAKLSPRSLSSPPKAEENYSFPLVKRKFYENLFQNVLLKINIFKTCNRKAHFLLEGPFGDFEQKCGIYNY